MRTIEDTETGGDGEPMQLQPRQQLLEIWRATARSSYVRSQWQWGGPDRANSISAAEQLLCLLAPATEVPVFRLDRPDETAEDAITALGQLGDSVEIPKLLIRVLSAYLKDYSAEDGTPIFSGGTYFGSPNDVRPLDDEQRGLDVVDSFAISVTLTVAVIGFVRVFRSLLTRESLRREADELEQLASRRLTAAMVGLLRSFSVNVFSADSDFGVQLTSMVNQDRLPTRQIVEELHEALREINARLRDDVTIGSGAAEGSELDNPNRLFECGWSWGIVKDAPEIETVEDIGPQRKGVAQAAPHLYFTVIALEAIQTLFSERTRLFGLLSEAQLKLAQSLQLRWELTQSYWSTIATFGSGRWPIEDLPWRTTDGVESDYLALLVSGIVVQGLVAQRASDAELGRIGAVLEELARRGRITRRPFAGDASLRLHYPGIRLALELQDDPDQAGLGWTIADFSPLLLRRTLNLAGLIKDGTGRQRLLDLSDDVWGHLRARRISEGDARGLWDEPAGAFPGLLDPGPATSVSWYYTKRVIDCLVAAAKLISSPPQPSEELARSAAELLVEADHLFDQEMLYGSSESGRALQAEREQIKVQLQRAHSVRREQPGTAVSLTQAVLLRLDRLSAARRATNGMS